MLLFDEDAGADVCEMLPGSGELASGELASGGRTSGGRTVRADTELEDASAIRLRRLKELPTSLPVGGIITPV
jgi:hypothetical protein